MENKNILNSLWKSITNALSAYNKGGIRRVDAVKSSTVVPLQELLASSQDDLLIQFENWTYKAVDLKANAVASVDFDVYKNDQLEDPSFLKERLLQFNDIYGWRQALYTTVVHLSLIGRAFWLRLGGFTKQNPPQFYVLNPNYVELKFDNRGILQGYTYGKGKSKIDYTKDDVVYFCLPSPTNPIEGYSPLQASKVIHNLTELSLRYSQNVFGNMGSMAGFMVFDDLSEDERAIVEEKIKEKFTGVRNAGRIGVINKDFKYIEINRSPKDLEFKSTYTYARDAVLAIQGVPKDLIVGGSTYQNMKEAQKVFQLYTVLPLVKLVENTLSRSLVKMYSDANKAKYAIYFDSPVENDKQLDNAIIIDQYRAGIITLEEARDALGYSTASASKSQSVKSRLSLFITTKESLRDALYTKQLEQEDFFKEKIARFFTDQWKRLSAAISGKSSKRFRKTSERTVEDLLHDIRLYIEAGADEEDRLLQETMLELYLEVKDAYTKTSNEVLQSLGGTLEVPDYDVDAATLAEIRTRAYDTATTINQTTYKEILGIVEKSVQENAAVDDIIKSIRERFASFSLARAEKIARTEVTYVKGAVQRSIYAQHPEVQGFMWLSAKDRYTREDHLAADGQIVPKGLKFRVGGEYLRYPGDKNGRPSNVINCRCDAVPVLKGGGA